MSRKTIFFDMPPMTGNETLPAENLSVPPETSADHWVQQEEAQTESSMAAFAEPEAAFPEHAPASMPASLAHGWFEAATAASLMPYLLFWNWTLGAAERNYRFFLR